MYKIRDKEMALQNPRLAFELKECAHDNQNIPLKKMWSERWCTVFQTFEETQVLHDLLEMEIRSEDVFVITFMKCGTTWMQEAVWLLQNELNFEAAKQEPQFKRSPFLEYLAHDTKGPNVIQMSANLESPRIFKTHMPASLCPRQMWQKRPKIIYVARNPKDVIVSSYHFSKALKQWLGTSMEQYVDDFLNNEIVYSNFWSHLLEFWQMRNEDFIFFTTYEEMQRDLPSILQKLCKFLERPQLSAEQMDMMLEHLSFERMKNNKTTNPTNLIKILMPYSDQDFNFMRRGVVGAYKDELTPELSQKIDEWSRKCLAEYGLKEEDIFGQL